MLVERSKFVVVVVFTCVDGWCATTNWEKKEGGCLCSRLGGRGRGTNHMCVLVQLQSYVGGGVQSYVCVRLGCNHIRIIYSGWGS